MFLHWKLTKDDQIHELDTTQDIDFNIESLYLSHTVFGKTDSEEIESTQNTKSNLNLVWQIFEKFSNTGLKNSLETIWVSEAEWDLDLLKIKLNSFGYNVNVLDW